MIFSLTPSPTPASKRLRRLALLIMASLAAPAWPIPPCGSNQLTPGLRDFEVEERCGPAAYRASYPLRSIFGEPLPDVLQHWYYNPGPSGLVRRLSFRQGELLEVTVLERGFRSTDRPRCQPNDLRTGISEYRLLARCGPPLASRLLWRGLPRQDSLLLSPSGVQLPVQEWVFEFGRHQFRRAVLLENGLVSSIETLDKPR